MTLRYAASTALAHVRTGLICTVLLACSLCCSSLSAQSRDRDAKKKDAGDKSASPQQLESRISKAEEQLLEEYLEVANEYYKQDQKELSIAVLERITKINPQMPGIRQRMYGIREELLQENGLKLDFDTGKIWLPVAEVQEGRGLRVVVAGEYKLDLTTPVTLAGLPTGDPAKDHFGGVPFGAVIGMVFTDGKPGDPFLVGGAVEYTPKKSGTLFLRVNVPATAKCRGDLKVQISGAIQPVAKKGR